MIYAASPLQARSNVSGYYVVSEVSVGRGSLPRGDDDSAPKCSLPADTEFVIFLSSLSLPSVNFTSVIDFVKLSLLPPLPLSLTIYRGAIAVASVRLRHCPRQTRRDLPDRRGEKELRNAAKQQGNAHSQMGA